MAASLPLLVFPSAKTIPPSGGSGFPPSNLHLPGHARQTERLNRQLAELQKGFASLTVTGLEPEMVLVIEIVGNVENFKQAIDRIDGLEWLGEWETEEIEPDEDFYARPTIGVDFFINKIDGIATRKQSKEIQTILKRDEFLDKTNTLIKDDLSELSLPKELAHFKKDILNAINGAKGKRLEGRLFLSFTNQRGLEKLLSLWKHWEKNKNGQFPRGENKWRHVFKQTRKIRRWGFEETLHETGMIRRWRDDLRDRANEKIRCQIEFFYRQDAEKQRKNEDVLKEHLVEEGGELLSRFLVMDEIAFHAVKVELRAEVVRRFLDGLDHNDEDTDIQLFKIPHVMYFRPTGQHFVSWPFDEADVKMKFPEGGAELPPVVALLDGVPNLQHEALSNRLLLDDPDDLSAGYQPGQKRHGTAMASLVVHGELPNDQSAPLASKVYCRPVMQPNPEAGQDKNEYLPDDIFFEDRIERAVRRMFIGEGKNPAQAPKVKVINLSIGDMMRPFIHTPSPWARLLDWLSSEYRVLFCVSAGNFSNEIDLGIPSDEFAALSDEQKVEHTLKCIARQLSERRLLSPAESLNALTIGALHADESGNYKETPQRVDLLPNSALFSPISRFGHGFRRSVKPEILFPGGRQLYKIPHDKEQNFSLQPDSERLCKPGQRVAYDSEQEGERSKTGFTRGTSNATALATRSGARIYEVLAVLQAQYGEQIKDNLVAVLIKALLVHGAQHPEDAKDALKVLKDQGDPRHFREMAARYIGYGAVNIERVLACTEQRATVLGSGEILQDEIHEYRFPLPPGLSGRKDWRRMVVTLAWFSGMNAMHRRLRQAKLTVQSGAGKKWCDLPLKLSRVDADYHQVSRGTVQHEILEGKEQISAYEEESHILLNVTCRADAIEELPKAVPYGIAVTLEIAEDVDVPIYRQIQARLKPKVLMDGKGS